MSTVEVGLGLLLLNTNRGRSIRLDEDVEEGYGSVG